ncbi:MAG: RIP metalloprotease RseP [Paracoccaceae bacterium]
MDLLIIFDYFGSFLTTAFAFVLCLSVIVFIHEFGHYFIGKICGIQAEVFSLGFGPVLFSKRDKKGTKWQIAALPLGGFVKFLGDQNSASAAIINDSENKSLAYQRRTMHGAPLWARFLTVAAGPVFNFLFSMIIFFIIFMNQGSTKIPLTVEKIFDTPFDQKFIEGDVIKSISGITLDSDLSEFTKKLEERLPSEFASYVVERKGNLIKLENVNQNPPFISQVLPKSAAISSGLAKGDLILSINSVKITNFDQIKSFVENSNGESLIIEYWRKGFTYSTDLNPTIVDVPKTDGSFASTYRIGIVSSYFPFEPATEGQSPVRAAMNSAESTYHILKGSIKGLYHIVFGNISSCNLSGPISIAETSGQMVKQGSLNYLWFIAVLSVAIGMINLFPIPVLDGGHLMFFAFEAVLGKKPNPAVVNGFMTLGFFIIVSLMVFSIFNDVLCP